MRKSTVALMVAAAFATGVLASDGLRATIRLFAGATHPRCIDGNVCVGAQVPRALFYINADKHGLTSLYCDEAPNPSDYFIFLDGVIAGNRCPGRRFTVELRSPTTRTLLKVNDGRLVDIEEGPLHVIDL